MPILPYWASYINGQDPSLTFVGSEIDHFKLTKDHMCPVGGEPNYAQTNPDKYPRSLASSMDILDEAIRRFSLVNEAIQGEDYMISQTQLDRYWFSHVTQAQNVLDGMIRRRDLFLNYFNLLQASSDLLNQIPGRTTPSWRTPYENSATLGVHIALAVGDGMGNVSFDTEGKQMFTGAFVNLVQYLDKATDATDEALDWAWDYLEQGDFPQLVADLAPVRQDQGRYGQNMRIDIEEDVVENAVINEEGDEVVNEGEGRIRDYDINIGDGEDLYIQAQDLVDQAEGDIIEDDEDGRNPVERLADAINDAIDNDSSRVSSESEEPPFTLSDVFDRMAVWLNCWRQPVLNIIEALNYLDDVPHPPQWMTLEE
ncbi:hypothetical protein AA313_de0204117 [Arthrobotrys entomopaga]|nr:hypothetical protein AA313_de0204117 [Arthrobotrys entomopaga]